MKANDDVNMPTSRTTQQQQQSTLASPRERALRTSISHGILPVSLSTSSLPGLVNYAFGSPSSRKDEWHQDTHAQTSTTKLNDEMKRRQSALRRRNSFSNFLSYKAQNASMEESDVYLPPLSTKKSRHRPRSLSEVVSIVSQVEQAPPVATTTKTPTYEYYGFVMYLVSFVALGIYLIWAYVPDEVLHSLGITYYPSRYWALAIPIWIVTLVWFIFISFMSINLMNTAPFDSFTCITDEHANVLTSAPSQKDHPEDYIPELHDIPISVVNAMLYQDEMDDVLSDKAFAEAHTFAQHQHENVDWPMFKNFPLS
ncbi:PIG-P-domain-containing protein [Umbelopsis sp. PMI_123]|nr:PIG-P-domain-containing protein [Umbelopsis sp. PMI_123]